MIYEHPTLNNWAIFRLSSGVLFSRRAVNPSLGASDRHPCLTESGKQNPRPKPCIAQRPSLETTALVFVIPQSEGRRGGLYCLQDVGKVREQER